MSDDRWFERLKTERAELNLRLVKLSAFVNGNDLFKLPEAEQGRLMRQQRIMEEYLYVLDERIKAAEKP